jgi:hypothetical protein
MHLHHLYHLLRMLFRSAVNKIEERAKAITKPCRGHLSGPSGYNLPLIGHVHPLQQDTLYGIAAPPGPERWKNLIRLCC